MFTTWYWFTLKLSTKKLSEETIKNNIMKQLDRLTTPWDATEIIHGVTKLVQPKRVTRKLLVNHNYTVEPLYSRHPWDSSECPDGGVHISGQGSAHTGREWSAPITTQPFLLSLKLVLPTTTQIILGRTLQG